MSFEGYYQELCAEGHLNKWDVYDEHDELCTVCGRIIVWRNLVDTTNDAGIPVGLAVKEMGEKHVCETCGIAHYTNTIYHIPSD